MRINLLITFLILFVFCAQTFAGDRIFIELGLGSKYINGGMTNNGYDVNADYLSDFELDRDPLNETYVGSSVTDGSTLNWKNKILMQFSGTFGYKVSSKYTLTASFHIINTKEGYNNYFGNSNSYPNINTEIGEHIEPNTQSDYTVPGNWYDQYNIRLSQQIYLSDNFYFITGAEFIHLNINFGTDTGRPYTQQGGLTRQQLKFQSFSEDVFGFVGGFGYELPLTRKSSLVISGIYSFAEYNGNVLNLKDLNFDIGGIELGYTLRYNLF